MAHAHGPRFHNLNYYSTLRVAEKEPAQGSEVTLPCVRHSAPNRATLANRPDFNETGLQKL